MSLILLSVIAAITAFVLGFVWHGPVFGKMWMRANASGHDTMPSKKDMAVRMVINFVTNLLMAFVTFLIVVNLRPGSIGQVFIVLAVMYVGFVIPLIANNSLWNGRPTKSQVTTFLISAGYHLVNLAIWGGLIAWLG